MMNVVRMHLIAVAAPTLACGCAGSTAPRVGAPTRIPARADHVIVRVEGRGVVTGFAQQRACGPSMVERCDARRDEGA